MLIASRRSDWTSARRAASPPRLFVVAPLTTAVRVSRVDSDAVSGIQHMGGTILGSARGGFDLEQIFGFCNRYAISQLFVVGGDGTHRAANKVGLEALARKLNISVAGSTCCVASHPDRSPPRL